MDKIERVEQKGQSSFNAYVKDVKKPLVYNVVQYKGIGKHLIYLCIRHRHWIYRLWKNFFKKDIGWLSLDSLINIYSGEEISYELKDKEDILLVAYYNVYGPFVLQEDVYDVVIAEGVMNTLLRT